MSRQSGRSRSGSGWRRSRKPMTMRRAVQLLSDPATLRLAAIGLLVIGVLWVSLEAYRFNRTMGWWSDMSPYDDRSATLYGVGVPKQVRSDGGPWRDVTKPDMTADAWAYTTAGGGRVEVVFDKADGRANRISCEHPQSLPVACQPLFGIGLGTDELTMLRSLGDPTRQQLAGESKIVWYDDIGASYAMKRYIVYKMTITRHRGSTGAVIGRFIRSLFYRPW